MNKSKMDDILENLLNELEQLEPPKVADDEVQKFLYRELVRLSLMIDPEVTEPQIFGRMSALVRKVKTAVTADNDSERVQQLLDFIYQAQGFQCYFDSYFHTENLLMHHVLTRRQGMPVSIGAVVLYLAASLKLPIFPVHFPTQLVLRAELKNATGGTNVRFINPWDGSTLSVETLTKWLEGEVGYGAEVSPIMLKRAELPELLERVETVFKMALTSEGKYEETLRLIEYRLMFSPEDPYEIRDRGMILASMNCYQAALEDLNYFIDQCPEDPSAVLLKMEVKGLEQKSRESLVH